MSEQLAKHRKWNITPSLFVLEKKLDVKGSLENVTFTDNHLS